MIMPRSSPTNVVVTNAVASGSKPRYDASERGRLIIATSENKQSVTANKSFSPYMRNNVWTQDSLQCLDPATERSSSTLATLWTAASAAAGATLPSAVLTPP